VQDADRLEWALADSDACRPTWSVAMSRITRTSADRVSCVRATNRTSKAWSIGTKSVSVMYGPASAKVTSSVRIDEDVDALAELWTADAPEPERALRQHLLRLSLAYTRVTWTF